MAQSKDEHLEAKTIASYLDGALSIDERQAVERHFLVCGSCRRDWAEAAEFGRKPRTGRWVAVGIPAAAAAALVLAFLGPLQQSRVRSPGRPILRGAQTEGVLTFAAVAPVGGAELPVSNVAFSWRSEGPDAHYLLTLTDENGDVVWSTSTTDTLLALPREVGLVREGRYFWFVDALLEGARSSTTGVQEFVVKP